MKIAVGLSGGVDSTLVALMLKNQGCDVVGISMSFYNSDLPENEKQLTKACYGRYEKQDIKDIHTWCLGQGIEHHTFDISEEFKKTVLAYFKQTYLSGATPNPCVFCNTYVKFGLLLEKAKQAGVIFDKFATGHYARVEKDANGRYLLKKGIEGKKDQSYFLYRLTQEQLANIWMPLGTKTKEEIREYAKSKGLVVAEKPDSQDFYEGDYNELLQVPEKIGNIVDTNGKVLGTHKGFWNYTIGQRKGLGVSSTEPLYVVELRKDTNEVVVGSNDKTMKNILYANELNFIGIEKLNEEIVCEAKIRSSQIPQKVKVTPINEDRIKVEFENMQKSIAIGQSIVLYDDDIILGGGIIDSIE